MKPAQHTAAKKSRLPWVHVKGTATRPNGCIFTPPAPIEESQASAWPSHAPPAASHDPATQLYTPPAAMVDAAAPVMLDPSRAAGVVTPLAARSRELVLSLYPGVDVLGRGFSANGFCVVQGPDLLLDARIEDFCGLAGRFDGVIAGPPCQNFSDANRRRDTDEGDRLLREFLRCVDECKPLWWLCENVRNVPDLVLPPYHVQRLPITDLECGGRQRRLRHIQFGSLDASIIRPARTKPCRSVTPRKAVLCRPRSPHDRHCRRAASQGAEDLSLLALTRSARARAIGNAVTAAVAHTLARAVTLRSSITPEDCVCGCGRRVTPPASQATAACRKRMERRRRGASRIVTLSLISDFRTLAPEDPARSNRGA